MERYATSHPFSTSSRLLSFDFEFEVFLRELIATHTAGVIPGLVPLPFRPAIPGKMNQIAFGLSKLRICPPRE